LLQTAIDNGIAVDTLKPDPIDSIRLLSIQPHFIPSVLCCKLSYGVKWRR